MKLLFSIAILVLISGCSNPTQNIKPEAIPDLSKQAIIYGTLSKQGGSDAWLYVNKQGEKRSKRIDAVGLWGSAKEINEEGKVGSLFAIELSPGKYDLHTWQMYVFAGGSSYFYVSPPNKTPIPFEVNAGDVLYLGSFNIKADMGRSFFNVPIVVGATAEVSSQVIRDKGLFKKKYPTFRTARYLDYSMHTKQWDGQTGEKQY